METARVFYRIDIPEKALNAFVGREGTEHLDEWMINELLRARLQIEACGGNIHSFEQTYTIGDADADDYDAGDDDDADAEYPPAGSTFVSINMVRLVRTNTPPEKGFVAFAGHLPLWATDIFLLPEDPVSTVLRQAALDAIEYRQLEYWHAFKSYVRSRYGDGVWTIRDNSRLFTGAANLISPAIEPSVYANYYTV